MRPLADNSSENSDNEPLVRRPQQKHPGEELANPAKRPAAILVPSASPTASSSPSSSSMMPSPMGVVRVKEEQPPSSSSSSAAFASDPRDLATIRAQSAQIADLQHQLAMAQAAHAAESAELHGQLQDAATNKLNLIAKTAACERELGNKEQAIRARDLEIARLQAANTLIRETETAKREALEQKLKDQERLMKAGTEQRILLEQTIAALESTIAEMQSRFPTTELQTWADRYQALQADKDALNRSLLLYTAEFQKQLAEKSQQFEQREAAWQQHHAAAVTSLKEENEKLAELNARAREQLRLLTNSLIELEKLEEKSDPSNHPASVSTNPVTTFSTQQSEEQTRITKLNPSNSALKPS